MGFIVSVLADAARLISLLSGTGEPGDRQDDVPRANARGSRISLRRSRPGSPRLRTCSRSSAGAPAGLLRWYRAGADGCGPGVSRRGMLTTPTATGSSPVPAAASSVPAGGSAVFAQVTGTSPAEVSGRLAAGPDRRRGRRRPPGPRSPARPAGGIGPIRHLARLRDDQAGSVDDGPQGNRLVPVEDLDDAPADIRHRLPESTAHPSPGFGGPPRSIRPFRSAARREVWASSALVASMISPFPSSRAGCGSSSTAVPVHHKLAAGHDEVMSGTMPFETAHRGSAWTP